MRRRSSSRLRSGELDRRVDVYALGCVLYEMLTGRVPLEGDSVATFWQTIQVQFPPAPSALAGGIPPSLDAVVMKALSKRRDDRYESAGALARAAKAALQAPPVLSPRSSSAAALTTISAPNPAAFAGPVWPPQPAPTAALDTPPVHSGSKRGKRRWLIGGGAFVVIAAAAVAAVLLLTSGSKPVPGVPLAVKVAAGRGTVKVDWSPGTGKVDHYVIYRDGKPVGAFVTETSFTDTLADTNSHSYTVQAVNAKGTTSVLSAAAVTAAEIRELNPAENALVAMLPTTLVDAASCKPILNGLTANLNVAITCGPKPGQVVTAPGKVPQVIDAYGAPGATQFKAALSAEAVAHGAKSGNCASVPQRGTWNFTETPKVVNGQIICYRTTTSTLLWSYDSKLFYVKIQTSQSYQSLVTYWEDASLHLP